MICDVLSSFLLFDVGLQGAFGAFSRFCSRKPTAISCRLFAIVWYCLNHIWHLIRWKWWYMMVATARLRSILVGMSEMLIDCVFTGWFFKTSIFRVSSNSAVVSLNSDNLRSWYGSHNEELLSYSPAMPCPMPCAKRCPKGMPNAGRSLFFFGQWIGWQAGCLWNHGQALPGMFV